MIAWVGRSAGRERRRAVQTPAITRNVTRDGSVTSPPGAASLAESAVRE
jgi:hypothetical protein